MMQAVTSPPFPPRQQELVCRQCGCRHFLTVYTRPGGDGIVRRKRCRNCGQAIMTREKVV